MAPVSFYRGGTNEALKIGMNTDVMSHFSAADSDCYAIRRVAAFGRRLVDTRPTRTVSDFEGL